MTFLKALVLCMTAQGIAGFILSSLATGYFLGQPFALIDASFSESGKRALTTAIASLFPSIVVVGLLIILAPRSPQVTQLRWIVGAAMWGGLVWSGLGLALVLGLPSDPYLKRLVSMYALAGVFSGGTVGVYMSLVKKRPIHIEGSQQA